MMCNGEAEKIIGPTFHPHPKVTVWRWAGASCACEDLFWMHAMALR